MFSAPPAQLDHSTQQLWNLVYYYSAQMLSTRIDTFAFLCSCLQQRVHLKMQRLPSILGVKGTDLSRPYLRTPWWGRVCCRTRRKSRLVCRRFCGRSGSWVAARRVRSPSRQNLRRSPLSSRRYCCRLYGKGLVSKFGRIIIALVMERIVKCLARQAKTDKHLLRERTL